MRHLPLWSAPFSTLAVTGYAVVSWTDPAPEAIEIEVAAHELADCHHMLAQVADTPAVTDSGAVPWFATSDALPTVACVVR